MPLPVNPPPGPVSLSPNARTVLEKRYLVKNEQGQVTQLILSQNGRKTPGKKIR